MLKILLIALVVIVLLMIPIFNYIIRWIIFLPLAFIGGLVVNLIDIVDLMTSIFLSHTSATIGLIIGVIGIFKDFLFVTIIARVICPARNVGWFIAFILCVIWALYNLSYYHVLVLYPLGVRDPSVPLPQINWTHTGILAISALMGAFAAKQFGSDT